MLKGDVVLPSQLGATELAAWTRMQAASSQLQRAFFTPAFGRACEAAGYRVRVGVLQEAGALRGFFPFQFDSFWTARLGLAERVGGSLCDDAGLIAEPDFITDPVMLLRCCGLGRLFVTHLVQGQEAFGLVSESYDTGHQVDLAEGSEVYFAGLTAERRGFVMDTDRRRRRAERDYGSLRFTFDLQPDPTAIADVIVRKREQYRRTGVPDIFADPRRLLLI